MWNERECEKARETESERVREREREREREGERSISEAAMRKKRQTAFHFSNICGSKSYWLKKIIDADDDTDNELNVDFPPSSTSYYSGFPKRHTAVYHEHHAEIRFHGKVPC